MTNRIHFLNTGHSDCIILESNSHYAMIDSAEDTDFPPDKPWLNLKGYEQEVCSYLLKNCKGENGKVTLDFILGTHAHSDHIGGFDTVINHPDITVKKAFLKQYCEEDIFIMERKRWDNKEVYMQMKNALTDKNIPIVEEFDNYTFSMGDFRITLLNSSYKKPLIKFGENVNSVSALVEYKNKKALLVGDTNYKNGGENRLIKKVGKVDLLKVGHHGYIGSTSFRFVKALMPEYAVVCNSKSRIFPDVMFKLKHISHSKILCTEDLNGIIADFTDDNDIEIKTNIM